MRPLALLTLLSLATPAFGFVTTLGDRTRWRFPPTWRLGSPTADLPYDSLLASVEASVRPWTQVPGVDLPLTQVTGAADIRIEFLQQWPPELGPAVTGNTITTTAGGYFVGADVYLNDAVLDFTDQPDQPESFLPGVLTHEIGHALGLAHSPQHAATMYWHYRGADGATLEADDARGLRFLYGPPGAVGEACDTCLATEDCAPGAYCLRTDDGRAYCGAPCASGCRDGFDCTTLQNGADSCWPRAGTCDDHGVGLAQRGEACWGANHCAAPLRCAVVATEARCASDCDADLDCFVGERCVLGFGGATACLPRGQGLYGAACEGDLDCQDGLCLGAPGARACRATCAIDAHCAVGQRCVGLGSPTGEWGGCVEADQADGGVIDRPADAPPPAAAPPAGGVTADEGCAQSGGPATPFALLCLLALIRRRR